MYDKSINPVYETNSNGKRRKLTGYLAELHDGNILLHSQEYSTNSQAERALDQIVFDLLTDLHEHGLVDDVPAALEAEGVTSTHLPIWQPVRIRIPRGTEIVHQSSGRTRDIPSTLIVSATRDPQSGCMLFQLPSYGACYVAEGWVPIVPLTSMLSKIRQGF